MIIGLDHVGLSGPVSKHCFGAGQGGHPRTEQWKSQVMARSRSLVGASISRQLQGRQCQNRASIHEHTSTITTSKSTTSLYNKQGTSCLHDVRCTSTAHINSLRSVTPSAHRQPSPPRRQQMTRKTLDLGEDAAWIKQGSELPIASSLVII